MAVTSFPHSTSTAMMPKGDGNFYLYLHGDIRKASRTKVGDVAAVELEFDDDYKSGPANPLPLWFTDALEHHPRAHDHWNRLVPSRQKEILRYLSKLKSPETQARNVQRAIHALSGGEERFLGRFWHE